MTPDKPKRTRRKAADRAKRGEAQPTTAKSTGAKRPPPKRAARKSTTPKRATAGRRKAPPPATDIPSVEELPPPALDPNHVPDGPGRPAEHRYYQLFERMAAPPEGDPYELACWMMRMNAIAAYETAQGRGNAQLNTEIRAFAGVIGRLIPAERILTAERSLRKAAAPPKPKPRRGAELTTRKATGKGLRK